MNKNAINDSFTSSGQARTEKIIDECETHLILSSFFMHI